MRVYLVGNGFPLDAKQAPAGMLARIRKGKVLLYFRSMDQKMTGTEQVYDMTGNITTVTGPVFPVAMKIEKEQK